jgi:NADPH:quinone reductase-like Zn-dependent oxidoreductase
MRLTQGSIYKAFKDKRGVFLAAVEGQLKAGQDILVLGISGVSIFALRLAKQMGARVIMTSSSDEKLERARGLGADFGVNYRRNENWCEAVLELTNGRGVDLVVETSGPALYRNP